MAEDAPPLVGRRLREIRVWRGLSLRAAAELSGLSASYLSRIERGERPVERRSTLEALAAALRVAPSELTGSTIRATEDPESGPAVAALRLTLADAEMGEPVEIDARPWPEVASALDAVNAIRPRADYAALGERLPALILELHAHLPGQNRRPALAGLVDCYSAAQALAKNLGVPDLAQVASRHVRDAAAALSGPEWAGLAAWSRAQAISSTARDRSFAVAVRGAEEVAGDLDRPEVADVYGSLHLTAALAAITLGRTDTAADHLAEAGEVAARPGVGTGFGNLWFSAGNVDIWRTMLAVEQGKGGRAVEIARAVDPATLPSSPSRRAAWWIDIGRGLAMERGTRDEAVGAFLTAEQLAPQRFRGNVFAREVVTDLLARARRDAGDRELRGMAYRMGVAG
ncbi:MAG: helix-turn-helix domain-containing protein [Pseudonocardia sp.]